MSAYFTSFLAALSNLPGSVASLYGIRRIGSAKTLGAFAVADVVA